jgi:hypothetical protein
MIMTRYWNPEDGDRFFACRCQLSGNLEEVLFQYDVIPETFASTDAAYRAGYELWGSDDFNILVQREGRLAASLWRDQIVDDEPEVMAEIARETGFPVHSD